MKAIAKIMVAIAIITCTGIWNKKIRWNKIKNVILNDPGAK